MHRFAEKAATFLLRDNRVKIYVIYIFGFVFSEGNGSIALFAVTAHLHNT
jgi:hypothetical protein